MEHSTAGNLMRNLSQMGDEVADAAAERIVKDLKGVSPIFCLVALMRAAGQHVDFYLSSGEENQADLEKACLEVLRQTVKQGRRFDG